MAGHARLCPLRRTSKIIGNLAISDCLKQTAPILRFARWNGSVTYRSAVTENLSVLKDTPIKAAISRYPAANRFRSTPIPSIATVTSIPGCIGNRLTEVPQAIRSPGCKVISCDSKETIRAGGRIMSDRG